VEINPLTPVQPNAVAISPLWKFKLLTLELSSLRDFQHTSETWGTNSLTDEWKGGFSYSLLSDGLPRDSRKLSAGSWAAHKLSFHKGQTYKRTSIATNREACGGF
jgi:hypothetical protein